MTHCLQESSCSCPLEQEDLCKQEGSFEGAHAVGVEPEPPAVWTVLARHSVVPWRWQGMESPGTISSACHLMVMGKSVFVQSSVCVCIRWPVNLSVSTKAQIHMHMRIDTQPW